jgi:transposase-like protein
VVKLSSLPGGEKAVKTATFKAFLAELETLTRSQILRLMERAAALQSDRESSQALSKNEPHRCPRCQGKLVRNGSANGHQRFLCRACSTSCCATTQTPLAQLKHKEKLAAYASCLRQGLTVRETAQAMGFSLSRAFRWRHRFLENPVAHQPHHLVGLVEVDETYFKQSQKGEKGLKGPRKRGGPGETVPVLVGRSRGQPYTLDKVLPNMSQAEVVAALAPCVDRETTVLIMDSHPAFRKIEKVLNITSSLFVAGQPQEGNLHVQSANSYHERLKSWLNHRLRGVATKYLPHYLAWQRLRTWNQGSLPAIDYVSSALGLQLINR